MDPHRTRVVALLENGCEDVDVLTEAFSSLVQLHEEVAIVKNAEQGQTGAGAEEPLTPTTITEGPLEFFSEKTKNMTPLEICVLTQNNVAMELLLQNGAQPDNISGLSCSALCKVCYTFPGNIAMMRSLLEHGANPDATTNNDTHSASCLIISVVKYNLDAVNLLLEFGADVSYEWKGQNALSMALDFKKEEVAEALENHEFRRAQDNRWRRFTDRKKVEANKQQQRQAVIVQRQLETDRQKMLHQKHTPGDLPKHSLLGDASSAEIANIQAAVEAEIRAEHSLSSPLNPDLSGSGGVAPSPNNNLTTSSVNVLKIEEVPPTPQQQQQVGEYPIPSPPPAPAAPESPAQPAPATNPVADVAHNMASMDWIVEPHDLQILKPISSGAHGEVFEGVLLQMDEKVAVKRFPCNDDKSRNCFKQECLMLSKFRHENIVMFQGAVIAPELCCILSELCTENLMDRYQRAPVLKWSERLRMARDIAKAMTYLHTRAPPIVHRDLKSMNILLDAQGNVKLCDFGMARTREHTYIATQHIAGSPSWMAPEVLRGDDFNDQSDVYAFGVIMWELMTLRVPWPDKNMAQLVGLVGFAGARLDLPDVPGSGDGSSPTTAGESGRPPATTKVGGSNTMPLPEGCPLQYVSLIRSCWEPAPNRPSFKTIRALLDGMMSDMD